MTNAITLATAADVAALSGTTAASLAALPATYAPILGVGWGVVGQFGSPGYGSTDTGTVTDGVVTSGTHRNFITVSRPCADLRLLYTNMRSQQASTSTSGETDGPNAITLRTAVEIGANIVPVFFNGARDVVIQPGAFAWSDPVPVDITTATTVFTRDYVTVSAGQKWPLNRLGQDAQGCGHTRGTPGTDVSLGGAVTASFSWLYGPTSVVGYMNPAPIGVGITGDSVAAGVGDQGVTQASGNFIPSFATRALKTPTPQFGFTRIAEGGECASVFALAAQRPRRTEALRYCKHVISNLGGNDIYSASASLPTAQASVLAVGTIFANRKQKYWQTTITPRSTSTDAFATVGNQTVQNSAQNTVRINLNNWLRAGAPIDPTTLAAVAVGTAGALVAGGTAHPFSGVFDIADLAESSRDSGLWKVGYMTGGDGTHPITAGHTAIAAAIDTTKFI